MIILIIFSTEFLPRIPVLMILYDGNNASIPCNSPIITIYYAIFNSPNLIKIYQNLTNPDMPAGRVL